jgi:hypothetical protein
VPRLAAVFFDASFVESPLEDLRQHLMLVPVNF